MEDYAVTIQKFYNGYKTRKNLNNIYKKLPNDLQSYILYFIKKDFYYEKYKKVLNNIINKKLNNLISNMSANYQKDKFIPFNYLIYLTDYRKIILHNYKLYAKYEYILFDKKYLYFNLLTQLNKIGKVINDYKTRIFNPYTNHIFEIVDGLYYTLDSILNPNTNLSSES
tara:strand:+ start:141 stop:647 length:507 start_codon:yes stop_codon:yes gene_type:complete